MTRSADKVKAQHECEGDNCTLCPRCYKATGKDVCVFTCRHDNGYDL